MASDSEIRTANIILNWREIEILIEYIDIQLSDIDVTAHEYGMSHQSVNDSLEAQEDHENCNYYWEEIYSSSDESEWPDPETTTCSDLHHNLANLSRAKRILIERVGGVGDHLQFSQGPIYQIPEFICHVMGTTFKERKENYIEPEKDFLETLEEKGYDDEECWAYTLDRLEKKLENSFSPSEEGNDLYFGVKGFNGPI